MNNCVKKGVLLVVAVFFFFFGWGQANVLEQQKKEFEQGKRDIDFLASYIANLKESKDRQALSRALDCYIVLLPAEQRYTEQCVQDFINYIDYQESQVCLDYIKNWDKLNLREEQVKQMGPKMEVMILWPVFHWMTSPAEKKPIQPDCEEVVLLLDKGNVSAVSPTCKTLLEMWQLYKRKDIDKMVKLFVGMLQSGWTVSGIVDTSVIGYLANYLLEETNVSQAREIQSVLENLLKDDSLEKSKVGLLKGWNDDFTGKVLLGEE